MKHLIIAALALVAAACSPQNDRDPIPRPKTMAEYNAALEASSGDRPESIPMLMREQKERELERMGGQASDDDFADSPGRDPEQIKAWREAGIAYFNAPFGTATEREAWHRYMRVIHSWPVSNELSPAP